MMDEKLDWTTDLGEAFVDQPKDVFASVQRLRAQAAAVGNLKTTPQQVVVKQDDAEQAGGREGEGNYQDRAGRAERGLCSGVSARRGLRAAGCADGCCC